MRVIAFAVSNSRQSINQVLAAYTASQVPGATVEILDLNDYEMPIYSEDRERAQGQPEQAHRFLQRMRDADALVIGYAEHNGAYSAAYKNVVDWALRIERDVFQNKPTLMLATSPGRAGGANVLALAQASAPLFAARVVDSVAVPSFHHSFDVDSGVPVDAAVAQQLAHAASRLQQAAVAA